MPRISKQNRQLSVYEVEICYRFTNIISVANLKSFHFKPELLVKWGGGGGRVKLRGKSMGLDMGKVFLYHTLFNPLSPFSTLCSVPSPPLPHFVQSPPSPPLPHFVQSPLSLYHTLFSPLSPFTTLCSISSPPFPHFVQSSHPHLTCLFLKFKDDFFKALWKSS